MFHIFPCHIWDVILPLDELIYFSEGFKPPTSVETHSKSLRPGRRALSLSDVNDLCSTLFRVALSSGMGHKQASTDEVAVG